MRRALRGFAIVAAALTALVAGFVIALRHPIPPGETGASADALAHEVERAVAIDAWRATGAVRFNFTGHRWLWDRRRNFARVSWKNHTVLLDVDRIRGRVYEDGTEIADVAACRRALDRAYRSFINDTFWFNPLAKLFDPGVTRRRALVDGGAALVVHYASGGVTPGDSYVWLLDDRGRPRAWQIHVKVVPLLKGAEISWEGWTRLPTGAWISTVHRALGAAVVRLSDVGAATTLEALEPGPDPFAAIEKF